MIVNYHWFQDKMEYFKYYGRDVENLLANKNFSYATLFLFI